MANITQTSELKQNAQPTNSRSAFQSWQVAALYLILVLGAILAVLPFYWMVSTSFMTLGETINRVWVPESSAIQELSGSLERSKVCQVLYEQHDYHIHHHHWAFDHFDPGWIRLCHA